MAEWTNIFELGEWEVYVQYYGATSDPSPNSRAYLVKASELDPRVGTVAVNAEGQIVCDFESRGTSSNALPAVVVMPVNAPPAAPVRLTCSDVNELSSLFSSFCAEIESISDNGGGTYIENQANTGNEVDYGGPGEWTSPTEAPAPLVTGYGMRFLNIAPGA